jgi:beta-glucanase (GH16 family)
MWSDEFDASQGSSLNPDDWTCRIGGSGWGNSERQYYTDRPENVSHSGDGTLVITVLEENPDDYSCWYGECTYTSARCNTVEKVEFTYGKVEARIRLPFGQGLWSALWMLGGENDYPEADWPAAGEIDIMENLGSEPQTVHGTIHGPGYSGGGGVRGSLHLDEPVNEDFHVFGIEWEPNVIRWYVDGEEYFTVTPDSINGRDWVYDHDFFLLMNIAVGGTWPGLPDETTQFPQTMEFDWIRLYQRQAE